MNCLPLLLQVNRNKTKHYYVSYCSNYYANKQPQQKTTTPDVSPFKELSLEGRRKRRKMYEVRKEKLLM